jgi:hypothetical protein
MKPARKTLAAVLGRLYKAGEINKDAIGKIVAAFKQQYPKFDVGEFLQDIGI